MLDKELLNKLIMNLIDKAEIETLSTINRQDRNGTYVSLLRYFSITDRADIPTEELKELDTVLSNNENMIEKLLNRHIIEKNFATKCMTEIRQVKAVLENELLCTSRNRSYIQEQNDTENDN